MHDSPLFIGKNNDAFSELENALSEGGHIRDGRIPSLITLKNGKHKGRIIAAADKASCGADWGFIETAVRISDDNGDTFSEIKTVFTPPVRKYPFNTSEFTSSFAIDPVLVECDDGKVILLVDFYPESKGLHAPKYLEKGNGYTKKNDIFYLNLFSGKTKLDGFFAAKGKRFALHTDGFVYDEKGNRTNYYLPQKHLEKNSFSTFGDMYFAVNGRPQYISKEPPVVPTSERGQDIYVGNIFVSKGKKIRDLNNPEFVKKREVFDENGELLCIENAPAPFRAPMISYILMFTSVDGGETFSSPVDITPYYKHASDGIFAGIGPGVGLTLKHGKKVGRILVPCYKLNKAFVIISDDNGLTWHRNAGEYCENIDECQLVEMPDGKVFCFGRPKGGGMIPLSVSDDCGENFRKLPDILPKVPQCQKSVVAVPADFKLPQPLVNDGRFILMSTPTGQSEKRFTRTDGRVFLGRIDREKVTWIKNYEVKDMNKYSKLKNYAPFYAYSCLSIIDDTTVGLLYEAYPSGLISFAKFTLD